MKSKTLKFSIFMLLAIICSCTFVFIGNKSEQNLIYAIEISDAYQLVTADGEGTYTSNKPIGTISGTGLYVVGEKDVVLEATAKANYQIIGFQITYSEQGGNTEYVWFDEQGVKFGTSKEIDFTLIGGQVAAKGIISVEEAAPVGLNNYVKTATLTIGTVFESMEITPIFDNIYANVQIDDLMELVKVHENHIETPVGTMYYETAREDAGITEYTKAYILKKDNSHYFYGTVYSESGKFYTLHEMQTDDNTKEKISLEKGAFKSTEKVNMALDVGTLSDVLQFDLRPLGDHAVTDVLSHDVADDNHFLLTKDALGTTKSFELHFSPRMYEQNYGPTTCVYVDFDKLYTMEMNFFVDDVQVPEKDLKDFFGEIKEDTTAKITYGNIVVSNYFAIKTQMGTTEVAEYIFKKEGDNNGKKFTISCAQNVKSIIDGLSYNYYNFATLDGDDKTTKSFGTPAIDKLSVEIKYTSQTYTVFIQFLEMIESKLYSIGKATETYQQVKRGEEVVFVEGVEEDYQILGYDFIGFAEDEEAEVASAYTCTIDKAKPTDAVVCFVYEKIDYSIKLVNFNQINIGGVYPINQITFTVDANNEVVQALTGSEYVLQDLTVKLGQTVSFASVINSGFVVNYSLSNPVAEYITNFVLDEAVITNNVTPENEIVIYVFEEKITYTLTYYTPLTNDPKVGGNVIMAEIWAEAERAESEISKYDAEGKLIDPADISTIVAKIVVSKLTFKDKVVLNSKGLISNADITPYTYMFSGFFEQTNNFTDYSIEGVDNPTYSRTQEITRNIEIYVKFAMPTTKIIIQYGVVTNDLADGEEIGFVYEFSQTLTKLDENEYEVNVAQNITITVSNIDFGYSLYGYELLEDKKGEQKNTNISISTMAGSNTIKILFERVTYQFRFSQFKMENGVEIPYGESVDKSVNVKDLTIPLTKTLGLYVYSVKFAYVGESQFAYDVLSSKLSETNDGKTNPSTNYSIILTKQEMGELVLNCGQGASKNIIKAQIVYVPYSYNIALTYLIQDKPGSEIFFPAVSLVDILSDKTEQEIKSAKDHNPGMTKNVVFENVYYGTNAKIILEKELMQGLKWDRWELNGQICATGGAQFVELGIVNRDMSVTYCINYEAYDINVIYDIDEGEPVLTVSTLLSGLTSKKITLFDEFEIKARAKRNTGMKLARFVQPVKFEYDELAWDLVWTNLFYYNNRGEKIINSSETYDPAITYFEDIKVLAEAEDENVDEDTYVDKLFLLSDYLLVGKTIHICVEYEKIIFTLDHQFEEIDLNGGTPDSEYELLFNEIYYFVDKDGNKIETLASEITFGETLEFYIQINKTAENSAKGAQGDLIYDLSQGVSLDYVSHGSLSHIGVGLYKVVFEMTSAAIPSVGEIIEINFYFQTAKRTLSITTQISNADFYKNGMMMINPKLCGWGNYPFQSGKNMVELKEELQYISFAQSYLNFEFVGYDETYEISKVIINGSVYSKKDFVKGVINCAEKGVKILESDKYGFVIVSQMWQNLVCQFYIQPKISFGNDGPDFQKEFKCGNDAVGIEQSLLVGSDAGTCDIIVGEQLIEVVKVIYLKNGIPSSSVIDEGKYVVQISFSATADMPWANQMTISGDVTLTITKKKIWLEDARGADFVVVQKDYSGSSEYDINKVLQFVTFTDRNEFKANYQSLVGLSFSLQGDTKASANSVTDGGLKTANASESVYDLMLENLYLAGGKADNFALQEPSFLFKNFVKINKVKLVLVGVAVEDKVYDGETTAVIKDSATLRLVGTVNDDALSLNFDTLAIDFTSAAIGKSKEVAITNLKESVMGATKDNYIIADTTITTTASIYPYSVSVYVRGVGEVTVFNERGLTDKSKVDLIPIGAELKVETFLSDSSEYRSIYKNISQHLRGNNAFAIGYNLSIEIEGEKQSLNKDLFVRVPKVKNLTGTLYLSGSKSGKISAETSGDGLVIDLSDIPYDVQNLLFIQQRILLEVWQIILIILLIILFIIAVVMIFVVVRKRKKKDYSVHEKI